MAFDAREGNHATLRAIVNPGVPWLWIGGLIVGLGAVLAIWPRPGRKSRSAVLSHRSPGVRDAEGGWTPEGREVAATGEARR